MTQSDGTILVLGQTGDGSAIGISSAAYFGAVPCWVAVDFPIDATFTCLTGTTNQWHSTACWSGLVGGDPYPDRGVRQYGAIFPPGAYTVILNPPDDEDDEIMMDGQLHIQGSSFRLRVESGRSFVVNSEATLGGEITINGGSFTAGPGASVNMDNTNFSVTSGGLLRLPSTTCVGPGRSVNVSGTGSRVELPNLASITGNFDLTAGPGGTIDLPVLVSFDPGEYTATGANSVLNIPLITTLPSGRKFEALNGGRINAGPLTAIASGTLRVAGATSFVDVAQVVSIDGAEIVAQSGAQLTFPLVTTYNTLSGGSASIELKASHNGSRLELNNVTSFTAMAPRSVALRADSSGGRVQALASQTMSGAVSLVARTANSVVEVGDVNMDSAGGFDVDLGGKLTVHGKFSHAIANVARFKFLAPATLEMLGGQTGEECAEMEVAGEDRGNVPAGWTSNFQLDRLVIGAGASVRLVDLIDNGNRNGSEGAAEALYVETIEFADTAARLDRNGLTIRYHNLVGDAAQIVNGTCDCPADIDGTGEVSIADLTGVLSSYGLCASDAGFNPAADLDRNGCIDIIDLSSFLSMFGTNCP